MRHAIMLTLSLALAAPAAGAYTAINQLTVNPLPGPADFEVVVSLGAGPRQVWCAAADYARRKFRSPAAQRIYLARGYGPAATDPARKGIAFTLAPDAALEAQAHRGVSVSMRDPGYNLTTSHAHSFCTDVFDQDEGTPPWWRP